MAGSGLSLKAHLIIDNCMLVMMTEYYCARQAMNLAIRKRVPSLMQWIADQLDVLRAFTPDGWLHCTVCVTREFNPRAGSLSQWHGIDRREYGSLESHVRSQLRQANVDAHDIGFLRNLPQANARLVGPGGLSNNDFSLVVLGAQLTAQGTPVYVLTNDQDLLSFISWVRARREARERWQNLRLLQGLHCLTYLELVHRACDIPTELMTDLIQFAITDHYARTELMNTRKGESIMQQLSEIIASLVQSTQIKNSAQGAAP